MKFMDILLNQKIFSVINDISITNLLKEVDVDSKYIAIEVNGEIKRACISRVQSSNTKILVVDFATDPYW